MIREMKSSIACIQKQSLEFKLESQPLLKILLPQGKVEFGLKFLAIGE